MALLVCPSWDSIHLDAFWLGSCAMTAEPRDSTVAAAHASFCCSETFADAWVSCGIAAGLGPSETGAAPLGPTAPSVSSGGGSGDGVVLSMGGGVALEHLSEFRKNLCGLHTFSA